MSRRIRQLSASVGLAAEGKSLVVDNPARETGENWSQGGEAFAVCYFSDGRGGSTPGTVQGDS